MRDVIGQDGLDGTLKDAVEQVRAAPLPPGLSDRIIAGAVAQAGMSAAKAPGGSGPRFMQITGIAAGLMVAAFLGGIGVSKLAHPKQSVSIATGSSGGAALEAAKADAAAAGVGAPGTADTTPKTDTNVIAMGDVTLSNGHPGVPEQYLQATKTWAGGGQGAGEPLFDLASPEGIAASERYKAQLLEMRQLTVGGEVKVNTVREQTRAGLTGVRLPQDFDIRPGTAMVLVDGQPNVITFTVNPLQGNARPVTTVGGRDVSRPPPMDQYGNYVPEATTTVVNPSVTTGTLRVVGDGTVRVVQLGQGTADGNTVQIDTVRTGIIRTLPQGATVTADAAAVPVPPLPPAVQDVMARYDQERARLNQVMEAQLAVRRQEVVRQLETMQQRYQASGQADAVAAVRDRLQQLRLETGGDAAHPLNDPGNLQALRGKAPNYYFKVVGAKDGAVWGNGVYTDDSSLSAAAVHAGILREAQEGVLHVTMLPGQPSYDGMTRNGIVSQPYGAFQGSFKIELAAGTQVVEMPQADPGTLLKFRDRVGQSMVFDVTGTTNGAVWGNGVYTDDSPLAVAAVHAGVLKDGEKGLVKVTLMPGQPEYGGTSMNGIVSQNYGRFDGSYKIEKAAGVERDNATLQKEMDARRQMQLRMAPAQATDTPLRVAPETPARPVPMPITTPRERPTPAAARDLPAVQPDGK